MRRKRKYRKKEIKNISYLVSVIMFVFIFSVGYGAF